MVIYYGMFGDNEGRGCPFPVRMYCCELSENDDAYDGFYRLMPPKRRERADRYRNLPDRRRCILSYALLNHALSALAEDIGPFGLPEGYLPIEEGPNGKPYLKDIPVCFNISHSGNWVLAALSPEEVGCDVEHVRRNTAGIAERFFAPEEHAYLLSIPDEEERNLEFTRLWTIKESAAKCCGEGIRLILSDFPVTGAEGTRTGSISIPGIDGRFHYREYESRGGYCFSVCSAYDKFEEDMRHAGVDCIAGEIRDE
ncbi:MAG: 4'-phosphopantetheinyl transferase superfamily protein [Lachnospiraceae bacterium]|nr:4'-phosphopantetheinyl transferase superfamily protein [Lachnospiraceae bacterium]